MKTGVAWFAALRLVEIVQQLFAVLRNRNDHPETRDRLARDVAAIDRILPDRQPRA